jgi:hypothetical protein
VSGENEIEGRQGPQGLSDVVDRWVRMGSFVSVVRVSRAGCDDEEDGMNRGESKQNETYRWSARRRGAHDGCKVSF